MLQFIYALITLLVYVLVGVSRSYLAFLFHQLDLKDSTIKIQDEQKSWIGMFFSRKTDLKNFPKLMIPFFSQFSRSSQSYWLFDLWQHHGFLRQEALHPNDVPAVYHFLDSGRIC